MVWSAGRPRIVRLLFAAKAFCIAYLGEWLFFRTKHDAAGNGNLLRFGLHSSRQMEYRAAMGEIPR